MSSEMHMQYEAVGTEYSMFQRGSYLRLYPHTYKYSYVKTVTF